MKTRALLLLAALLASSCGKVSMDVTSSDKKTNQNLQQAQTAGKTVYNGWKVKDAWDDALDKVSADDELAIGQVAAISVIAQVGDIVLEDEELLRYLNSVGNHVALQGESKAKNPRVKGRRFFFAAIKNDNPNAFSTPGGNVLVTTGLLEKLNSESELAFVLAHEIAHIDYEHTLFAMKTALFADDQMKSGLERLLRKKNAEPVTNLFDDLNVFRSASTLAANVAVGKANIFSIAQEHNADELGLQYVSKAGYDPGAGLRVLEILRESQGKWSLSHGSPANRAEELAKVAKKLPEGKTGYTRWQERGLPRVEGAVAAIRARSEKKSP